MKKRSLYSSFQMLIFLMLFVFSIATNLCLADTTKDKLVGYWKFKRGLGGPCAAQIEKLEYSFQRDGRYHGKAKMSTGATLDYSGTYSATDTECTTVVDGVTIGPFPYEIANDVLTISQPEFRCKVQLVREDY